MAQAPVAVPQADRLLPGGEDLAGQQQGRRQGPHQQLAADHQQGPPGDDAGHGELAHQAAEGLLLAGEAVVHHPLPGQLLLALLVAHQELAAQAIRLDQVDRAHQLALIGEAIELQQVALLGEGLEVAGVGQGPQQVHHDGDHRHDAHAAGDQEEHHHEQQREGQVDGGGEGLQGALVAQHVDAVEALGVGGGRHAQVVTQAHLREVDQRLHPPAVLHAGAVSPGEAEAHGLQPAPQHHQHHHAHGEHHEARKRPRRQHRCVNDIDVKRRRQLQ